MLRTSRWALSASRCSKQRPQHFRDFVRMLARRDEGLNIKPRIGNPGRAHDLSRRDPVCNRDQLRGGRASDFDPLPANVE
jgi:hypothetical protein